MKNIAIIGATGLVGETLLGILDKKQIEANYALFASQRSANLKIPFMHRRHQVFDVSEIFKFDIDYALFVSTNDISKKYIPPLLANGTVCIDNSSVFRLKDDVPLVVTEINGNSVEKSALIANPNCTTIQLVTVLNRLKPLNIKRVVASTYQAVSGAGKLAVEDLIYSSNYGHLKSNLPHPISNNFIPHIDEFLEDGYTKEEHKVIFESRKILNLLDLPITCNAVRVPVTHCHGVYANIEFEKEFDLEQVRNLLRTGQQIVVADDNQHNIYPMPILARGNAFVYVGRLNQDISKQNTLNCFIVADNLLRGAAFNAYEILMKKLEFDAK